MGCGAQMRWYPIADTTDSAPMKTKLHGQRPQGIMFGALLALGLYTTALPAEEAPKFPSNELMRHYRAMRDPQLSPDGKQALVRIDDATADGGKSHLWLIDVGGGKAPRQLT